MLSAELPWDLDESKDSLSLNLAGRRNFDLDGSDGFRQLWNLKKLVRNHSASTTMCRVAPEEEEYSTWNLLT
jgi:hypothetical protein